MPEMSILTFAAENFVTDDNCAEIFHGCIRSD
jgi:hypothetical protein